MLRHGRRPAVADARGTYVAVTHEPAFMLAGGADAGVGGPASGN